MRQCCKNTLPTHGFATAFTDETFINSRYLRARKFNANDAWTQFKDTEDMRKENDLPNYYDNIDVNDYEATRRLVCAPFTQLLSFD